MAYPFPPDLQRAIQEHLLSGEYPSEDEVLREALRALKDRSQAVVDEDPVVVEGIRRGFADMKAGRSQRLEDFDAEFRARHGIAGDG